METSLSQVSHLNSRMCPLSVDSLWFSFFGDVDLEVGALEELKHKSCLRLNILMLKVPHTQL